MYMNVFICMHECINMNINIYIYIFVYVYICMPFRLYAVHERICIMFSHGFF